MDVVPGNFLADVDITDDDKLIAERLPDNEIYHWRFHVPRQIQPGAEGVETFRTAMLQITLEIIRGISVMPTEQFFGVIKEEMAPRLFAQDFFAKRFPELLDFFSCEQRFGLIGRTSFTCAVAVREWQSICPPVLEWVKSTHPRFVEAAELKRIESRYSVGLAGLRFTLPRVISEPKFAEALNALRQEGWKDWHFVLAMLNAAANYRVTLKLGPDVGNEEFAKALNSEIFSEETADRPQIPVDRFHASALKMFLLLANQSTLSAEGLELHQLTPNVEGLFRYARERWRYFDLDIEHPPIFESAV